MRRKSLGKKIRFEVFKRDSFTCQYCGGKAPDVVLHVDHIQPVADGGSNDIVNLATACVACNLGKGARVLSDQAMVHRQQAQLENLQSRREQLEMMVEWQKGLMNLERDTLAVLAGFWQRIQPAGFFGVSGHGIAMLRKLLQKHSADDIMAAMREASLKMKVENGRTTHASVIEAFSMIPRLLRVIAESKKEPFVRDAYYARGILRNRFGSDVNEWEAKSLLLEAMNLGSEPEREKDWARSAPSYAAWADQMREDIRVSQEDT